MIVIVLKYLTAFKIRGLTFCPFIFVSSYENKEDVILINHEKIHIKQQMELLLVFFYLLYILEFVFRYIKSRNFDKAYRSISFEKEAYENESNLNYINQFRPFTFLKYL